MNGYVKLRKLRAEGQELGDSKAVFEMTLAQETEAVLGEYELFLHEHVENTRAARIAAAAPSHAQWAAIIRQSNALHRQMERKIRLLDETQERRRKLGSATDLLSRLVGQYDPSGGAGGRSALPTPNPSGAPCDAVGARHGVPVPTSATDEAGAAVREPPLPATQTAVVGAALVATIEQPQGLPAQPAEKTQNRGNEAKNSLKTNEVGETMCAKPTHFCAQKVRIEAKKSTISGARRAVVRAGRACVPRHSQDKLSHNRPFKRWPVRATLVAARGRAQMASF